MKNNTKRSNALYCCCIINPWLEVVKRLSNKCNIKPVYYIGWGIENRDNIELENSNCFYQSIEDAWKGKNFPLYNYNLSLDEDLLKSIAFEKTIAIKMMDRLDMDRHSFSFSDREAFFHYLLKRWLVIIDAYKIDLIISPSVPHRVFDYILYIASKIKNIEFLMFQMTPFGDSSFIINDINSIPCYMKKELLSCNQKINLRRDILDRINKVSDEYKSAIPDYMIEQKKSLGHKEVFYRLSLQFGKFIKSPLKLFKCHSSYHVAKSYMPYEGKNLKFKILYQQYKNTIYLRELRNFYENICSNMKLERKYVFVALHYQPEETSCPTGGAFVDQSLIIEILNDFLDSDYDIVIKEHKTQFHPQYEGAVGRSKNFYKNVVKISHRVKFVGLEEDPFCLIDNAIATVTVSGTIGWESVIRGTPALIFGRAWYEDMVGVFKIKSKDDLQKKWSSILASKDNIKEEDILNYHKNMQKYLIESPHYKAFVGKVDRSDIENINNIYRGICKHLKKIDFIAISND